MSCPVRAADPRARDNIGRGDSPGKTVQQIVRAARMPRRVKWAVRDRGEHSNVYQFYLGGAGTGRALPCPARI